MHGPAKSPIILGTPNAASVNAEAHCNMDISEAPEQTINSNNNGLVEQKNNIGVKTDVILDNFNTKGYMPIYFCSNRSLKGG